ncbi:MAG: DNA (cytosine-5-)-methyltransferase, partial [Firmicutes bacterium]|nr:DNA (cytosine-5-)-methyltransferase [Bacillota bacterium]
MALCFVDHFCGAGGLSLGLMAAGMEPAWAYDSDPVAVETHRLNLGPRAAAADAKALDPAEIPDADVWVAGVPCQAWSVAGRRRGADDERNLFPDFLRLAGARLPAWILIENVPGLLSWGGGRYFGWILGERARPGYEARWAALDAADYGVP